MKSKVAARRVSADGVLGDIQDLCRLADLSRSINLGADTVLKPNISWHYPLPGANTTPWQLEGTLLALEACGMTRLTCLENGTLVTQARRGERQNALTPVLDRHGVRSRYSDEAGEVHWREYRPRAKLRVLHQIFPEGLLLPDILLGANVVHLPTMKCHVYTTITGSMKNAFGGLLGKRRHYAHSWIHATLVDLLAIQREVHPGLFTVMDGTTAGNGPGPRTLTPVVKGYMLASSDPVAIDAVAAKMMGFDPMQIPFIRMAHEDHLGIGDPYDISLSGDDISGENWAFEVGRNLPSRAGNWLWFGPLQGLQKLLFRSPLAHAFAAASFLYHDVYRWPCIERRKFQEWKKNTEWGHLFETYERGVPMRRVPFESEPHGAREHAAPKGGKSSAPTR